jgi:hypothetical protein
MRIRLLLTTSLILPVVLTGCRRPEPPEAARARAQKRYLESQLAGLEEMRQKAEKGELIKGSELAISIDETALGQILNAALPREAVLADRVRVRIDKATPLFRGSRAAMVFEARAASVRLPGVAARVELGGLLDDVTLADGRLRARPRLEHFVVHETPGGDLGKTVLEDLARQGMPLLQQAIPSIEIPVRLEQGIRIPALEEGPVRARGGELPFKMAVAQVLPINQRLWILINLEAGPWRADAAEAEESR